MKRYDCLKVLVIEDNQMFRNLALSMIPNEKKYSAITAKDGLKIFKDVKPHITFLDIGLPDANGLDLLKKMKDITPDAFIVMLTQSRVLSDVDKAIKNGAVGYIAKPFSKKEVENYIKLCREKIQENPAEKLRHGSQTNDTTDSILP